MTIIDTTPAITPRLVIGDELNGCDIVAAVRQADRPGYLPGLHVVTCHARRTAEFITWEVAWQPGRTAHGREVVPGGRWVANAGHYFPVDQSAVPGADDRDMAMADAVAATRRLALADMIKRA